MAKVPKANGRPRKEVDYSALDNLCALQCTGEECASFLNMDYETLNRILKRDKHGGFKEYFALKCGKGKISLRRAQYQLATEDRNPTMLIWLGKQHLAQKDKQDFNHTSDDGSMTPKAGIDTSKLSTEALAEIMALHDEQNS